MEERPRNIPEDDSQEDIENEDGELSLNRRRLFLKNGFFREWLTSSSKESSDDEDEEDEDKPVFGSGKKFKGFLSKIFEEEPASDEEEPQKSVFEFGDFSSENPLSQSVEDRSDHTAEETEVRIDHEEQPVEVAEEASSPLEIQEQEPEITQEHIELPPEDTEVTQEINTVVREDEIIEQHASFVSAPESVETAVVPEKIEAREKDRSGALLAFMAAEFLSRRRDRKIKKEINRKQKNIEAIEESLQTIKKTQEVTHRPPQKETIKDDKNTTVKQAEKKEEPKYTEKKLHESKPEKPKNNKEIVIEKTTVETEQTSEPHDEVYFDKRHEVMGLEKPKSIEQEESKESLQEAKQQAPVSIGSVLATKQLDQLEYITAPIPMTKPGDGGSQQPFEQEIVPHKSAYRESVEAGFLVGLVIIGFIAIYVISK